MSKATEITAIMDEQGEHTKWENMADAAIRHFETLSGSIQRADEEALRDVLSC